MKNQTPMRTHLPSGMFALFLGSAMLVSFAPRGMAATLVHRWSFNETSGTVASDSVGGANATLVNGAAFNGSGQAVLTQIFDGDPSADTNGEYIALAPNILSNFTAVTLEAWVTPTLNASGNPWARVWDFGNSSNPNQTGSYKVAPGDYECRFGSPSPSYANPVWCEFWSATNGDHWNYSTTQMNDGAENYVVWTGDANTHIAKLYLNGVLVSTVYNFGNSPAVIGSTTNNWLGRSQYGSDPLAQGSYNEFRIYNGAISALQVAADYADGPDASSASYGTVTGIVLQVTAPAVGYCQSAHVLASATGLSATVDLYDDPGVTYVSGDTNILTVDAHGLVTGVAAGTTTLVASYGTLSSTQNVTVAGFQPVLVNRYSFNGTPGDTVAHDSVGGQNGSLMGAATYDGNGQVVLDGTSGAYVNLPAYLISSTNIPSGAVTLMGWATIDGSNTSWTYLYSFGNINGSGGLEDLLMTPINGGGQAQFGDQTDYNRFSPNLLGKTNVQVALVFNPNPNRSFLGCYVNGVLASWTPTPYATSDFPPPFSSVVNAYSFLGHSLWSADPYMKGSLREFRIYNGELSPFQIAAAYQAGPNSTNVTGGSPTSFLLNAGPQPIAAGAQRVVQAIMNLANATNVVVNGQSSALTFSSSDTSVATVGSGGLLTALKPGNATITAIFGYFDGTKTTYFTNTAAVTVFNDYPATLMHRYSFNDGTANDSVGGANGTLMGNASVSGGSLVLPNTPAASPATDYLQLPPGILTNNVNGIATTNAAFSTLTTLVAGSYTTNYNDPTVTVEAWATLAPSQFTWAALFNFGVQDTAGHAAYDLIMQVNNAGVQAMAKLSDSDDDNAHANPITMPPVLQAQTNIYITTVFDPPAGYVAIYTNGVLMGENYNVTITMAGVLGDRNIIGADNWPDNGMKGSIDEFRIWNGVLHPSEIAEDYLLGPNTLPTISPTLPTLHATMSSGQLLVSWPTNGASAFTLQSSSALGAGAVWTPVAGTPTVNGPNYEMSVPINGSVQFFELKQ